MLWCYSFPRWTSILGMDGCVPYWEPDPYGCCRCGPAFKEPTANHNSDWVPGSVGAWSRNTGLSLGRPRNTSWGRQYLIRLATAGTTGLSQAKILVKVFQVVRPTHWYKEEWIWLEVYNVILCGWRPRGWRVARDEVRRHVLTSLELISYAKGRHRKI